MLFDTHCHLTHPPLFHRLPEILAEARTCGVSYFLSAAADTDDWENLIALAAQPTHQNDIYIALGLHPWFIDRLPENVFNRLDQVLQQQPQALVGEIGLDFHRAADEISQRQQQFVFETQLDLAKTHRRAAVIHNVKSGVACLASLRRTNFTFGGFVHAFSGSTEEAHQWIKLGFKIGIGSLLLNPNTKKVKQLASRLPLDDMVLETDAPYMPPTPHAPNHPKNTRQIAEIIAELRGIDWQTVAEVSTRNALSVITNR
ncbi:TatD family hydrolase [Stenoxybacter acetivorans]|uniref:TatD family hydrolase n=1 Tax=Stenoxybacter acetivorans TaxID=422441 RepID=UPI000566608E|nr:TatD family hydrolase [Stenoxybacter acetivorans]